MRHQESDRPPTDLYLDTNDPVVVPQMLNHLSFKQYLELMDFFEIDIFKAGPKVAKKHQIRKEGIPRFFLPVTNERYLTFNTESVWRPLANVEDPEELDNYEWPVADDIFDYSEIADVIKTQPHRPIWTGGGAFTSFFCKMCDLCGIEKVLVDLIENPPLIEAMIVKILDFYKDSFKKSLEASKGRVEVFGMGDDFATQESLMFSRDIWVKYFKDPTKELCDLIKSYGVYVQYHSCGAVSEMLPDFIEAGVDILNPIQPKAKGMDAESLKMNYGNSMVFHGGIDIQEILPYGSEQDVRDEVDRVCSILGKDGGYIFTSGHGILRDIPPGNVVAMYDQVNRRKKI
jgi:uroporphyrinogen decarboxylase